MTASLTPALAGLGLGLTNVAAFVTSGRGIGVSNAFESGVAVAGREIAPDALGVNDYVAASEKAPKIGWEHLLVAGALAGGFLAARGEERTAEREGSRASSFVGGALVMLGARMAQGCTSGHCLTGTAQRAASSWVFTPVMFGSAVLTRRLLTGGAR